MKTEALQVELADRSYPIHFDSSIRTLADKIQRLRDSGQSLAAIVDQGLLDAQPTLLADISLQPEECLILPSGEPTKAVESLSRSLSFLASRAINRDGVLFALGGGVIGDLAGFTAASYLRGIDFHQVPTTLLAMVDSSVGGKTGINLPEGKNLAGAFWQPRAVYMDTALLGSLPDREFSAGMAEVIKYGLLADAPLFEDLEKLPTLNHASEELPSVIRRCCAIKARIVADDEKETAASGGRALLNLGHTFAHAIENAAGYGDYLHGEAVAIGLHLAAILSVELGQIDAREISRITDLLQRYQLPVRLKNELPVEELMQAIRRDKKNRGGQLRFVTLQKLGQAVTSEGIDPDRIERIWQHADPKA
ncbi:MAG: 3-dehydroquinate synthase [Coraliomargaritaceae bacterium]